MTKHFILFCLLSDARLGSYFRLSWVRYNSCIWSVISIIPICAARQGDLQLYEAVCTGAKMFYFKVNTIKHSWGTFPINSLILHVVYTCSQSGCFSIGKQTTFRQENHHRSFAQYINDIHDLSLSLSLSLALSLSAMIDCKRSTLLHF